MWFIVLIIVGLIVFTIGIKEVRSMSVKENIFDVLLSILFGNFDTSGAFLLLLGIALTVIGVLGLALGW